MKKAILQINQARAKTIGGHTIYSPLPGSGISQVSPFLLLDHLPPTEIAAGKPFYVPPHPHKGFEPVTLLFEGGIEHKDSAGGHGLLRAGAIQWTTAGRGIVHSEGLHPALIPSGTRLHLIQLWINLPKAYKEVAPRYQDLPADKIPTIDYPNGSQLRIIAGQYAGKTSPVQTYTNMLLLHGTLAPQTTMELVVPEGYNAALYMTLGDGQVQETSVQARTLTVFEQGGGDTITVHSGVAGAAFVLLSGEPIQEPVASYGPFVMNTQAEILEAIRAYQAGAMGTLE